MSDKAKENFIRMRLMPLFSLSALSCALIVTGCAIMQSPVVGDWSGTITANPQSGGMGAMLAGAATMMVGNSPTTLTLKNDGTGYFKSPVSPETTVTWKMDGDRVIVSGVKNAKTGADEPFIGKLSDDKKSLNFDLGVIKLSMTRQAKQ